MIIPAVCNRSTVTTVAAGATDDRGGAVPSWSQATRQAIAAGGAADGRVGASGSDQCRNDSLRWCSWWYLEMNE